MARDTGLDGGVSEREMPDIRILEGILQQSTSKVYSLKYAGIKRETD